MKKLLLGLILLSLAGCADLPLPGWADNGHISAYVPFGFFSHVDDDGAINISMPETTNGVSIKKLNKEEEFDERVQNDLKLTRRAYPKEWINVSEIKTLGHLKGRGFKVLVGKPISGVEPGDESYMFLVESDGWWIIEAASLNANKVSWRNILESLRPKKA